MNEPSSVHQVAYALDNQIGKIAAGVIFRVIGLTGFCGQFFFGWLSDHLRDANICIIAGVDPSWRPDGYFIECHDNEESLSLCPHLWLRLWLCGPMMPILVASRFGRHVMGSVYGLLTFLIGIGGAIGPLLGGLIFDTFGSYTTSGKLNILTLTGVAL